MRTYLFVMIVLLALTCVGKLLMLAKCDFPQRKPLAEAIDVAIDAALIVWAAVLLAGGAS